MFKIYIIFYRNINFDYYKNDINFNFDVYNLLKTSGYKIINDIDTLNNYKQLGFNIIEEYKFPIYNKTLQENKYFAPSAIYHSYKNNLHKNLKFIGFMEYDLQLYIENVESPTDYIKNLLKTYDTIILSGKHKFQSLYNQKNISINNQCWAEVIIKDYNDFFNTNYKLQNIYNENPIIGSQQSFICSTDIFDKLGLFLSHLIENKKDEYKPMPATIFERYIGMFLHFQNNKKILSFPHKALGYKSSYKL